MSEVGALGRFYVSRMHGIGPKSLAAIDRVLDLLGIAWSPIERTPQPKWPAPEQQPQQVPANGWDYVMQQLVIMREQVASMSRDVADLEAKRREHAEPDNARDLETAGNLVCLPGVKLADVRRGMGDDPGPTAA